MRNNNGLWNIPLKIYTKQSNLHPKINKPASSIINNDPSPSANIIGRVDKTKAELANYLSGAYFTLFPVLSYV